MVSKGRLGSRIKFLLNYHFWIIVALLFVITVLYYSFPISGLIHYDTLGLTRHSAERILLLIPIVYSAIIFGFKGGVTCLALALGIMLPYIFVNGLNRTEAVLDVIGVTLVGLLVNGWVWNIQGERRRRQRTIEKLENAQQKLAIDERRLKVLNNIFHSLSRVSDIQESLDRALDQIIQLMNLDMALIFVLNKAGNELDLQAYRGVTNEFVDGVKQLKVGEGLNGFVAQSGEPLIVQDMSNDSRLTREVVTKEKLVAQLIVPVKSRDKVIGTLSVGMRKERRFTDDEIEILTTIGSEIGVAIENGWLYEEQIRLAEQLRQSERNYRELFEKALDAIWVHDMQGNILTANEATARMVGYRLDELYRKNVRDFLDEASYRIAQEVRDKLIRGEVFQQPYEQKLKRRDGSEAYLMLTTSLITRNGKIKVFQHIARDVTEQRKMTENLRFYVQQITRAQEEERKRVARELHDDTAQALVVLLRQLDNFISNQPPNSRDIAPVERLAGQIDAILDGVRRFSQDLRPSILDDLGLIPALEWLASDLTEHFKISVGVEVSGKELRFAPEAELLFFRIAQEALSNVRKHSGASRAWVTIEFIDNKTILTIKDSGKGFKLPDSLSDLTGEAKLGLAGMSERARLLNGDLKITSEPGKGTIVTLEVPVF